MRRWPQRWAFADELSGRNLFFLVSLLTFMNHKVWIYALLFLSDFCLYYCFEFSISVSVSVPNSLAFCLSSLANSLLLLLLSWVFIVFHCFRFFVIHLKTNFRVFLVLLCRDNVLLAYLEVVPSFINHRIQYSVLHLIPSPSRLTRHNERSLPYRKSPYNLPTICFQ